MPRWQDHRSRSPGGTGEAISRAVAGFGRYPDKRPPGLRVDATGAFLLGDLMDAWGSQQGYSDQQVLDAIRKNMFYDASNKNGNLRFTIDADAHGQITIKVNQKRHGAGGGYRGGYAAEAANTDSARVTPTPARTSAWRKGDHLGVKLEPKEELKEEPDDDQTGAVSEAKPSRQRGGWRRSWEAASEPSSSWQSSQDWGRSSWKSAASWGWDDHDKSGGSSHSWSSAEKVQRWLAYALKKGYQELGIDLKAGEWALLTDLAEALGRTKPDFGIHDAAALREMLEQTDYAGRFEIDADGYCRKVQRELRQPQDRAQPARGGWQASAPAAGGRVVQPPWRGRPGHSAALQAPDPPGVKPAPPWQVFQDSGVIWYYYDGPLGRWWCQNAHEKPEPFVDGEERG
eukprot:TRINITY_DN36988_c0_g1_i1.p1 TRINITY_DN36988_c0_g1~~TRINITY_DN36988_c0_g1_i1.p1  ORF type:complete len:400 (-),score=64.58 TRINITY_DN36988_c0_g1_i1:88-1287(-)